MGARSGRSVRWRRGVGAAWLAGAVVLVGLVVWLGGVFGSGERVNGMWVGAELATDGSARISEVIDYDFGVPVDDRHGIFRDIPGLPPEAEVAATLDGRPVPSETEDLGSVTRIRLGDADRSVSGTHRYRLRYTLPAVAPHHRLAWDAVGTGWQVELRHVTVHVVAPHALATPDCVQGQAGSQAHCQVQAPAPGRLTVAVPELSAGEGVTLHAGAGRALGTRPRLTAPPAPAAGASGVSPLRPAPAAALAALVAAALTVGVLRIAGRDRVEEGGARGKGRVDPARLATGLTPSATPPEGLSPFEGGLLLAERVRPEHKVAWLLTAAHEKKIVISGGHRRPTVRRGPQMVNRVPGRALYEMFDSRKSFTLGQYDASFATGWSTLGKELAAWMETTDLWDGASLRRARLVRRLGLLLALLGLAVAVAGGAVCDEPGAPWLLLAGVGGAVAGAGTAMAVRAWELRVRTARGTRLWAQTESYRRFLAAGADTGVTDGAAPGTGDADRHGPDEPDASDASDASGGSRAVALRTAWAVALGEAERFAEATADAARTPGQAHRQSDPGAAFALAFMLSAANTTHQPTSSTSSGAGSSGYSGGSSGSGVGSGSGGGGGGSW
ncbi:DUF2207 domain-containing protein [Streptomyces sp. NPDC059740]|uniref:DUF2207 domain-containing protein n=1 Tax=Streptomyces sp. NPDC059740 TaxID=3346926 RepID=UPI00366897F1